MTGLLSLVTKEALITIWAFPYVSGEASFFMNNPQVEFTGLKLQVLQTHRQEMHLFQTVLMPQDSPLDHSSHTVFQIQLHCADIESIFTTQYRM